MNINKIRQNSKKIKLEIFKKFIEIKEGHPGSILSIFDVVSCMYLGKFINCKQNKKDNDYFIMSKGHAGSVQYPYLIRNKIIKKLEWLRWKKNGKSILKIFPNNAIPGVDVTSGSLGHGLGIASDLALSDKNQNIKKNIWVIIGEIVCNALSEKIDFGNDGREALLHRSGLSSDKIKTIIEKYI